MSAIDDLYERRCRNAESDIHELLPVLRYFASQCETVVEFGVRGGDSTTALLAGRPSRFLLSVDIDLSNPGLDEVEAAYGDSFLHDDAVDWRLREGSDLDYAYAPRAHDHDGDIDLLFIDTDHTYEQLSAELAMHGDHVKRWIIMHDTETYGQQLNPAIAVFLGQHPEWSEVLRLRNCNGLTVLERVE